MAEKWQQVFNKSQKNVVSKIYSVAEINTNINENLEYTNFLQRLTGDLYKRHKIKLSQTEQVSIAKAILKTLWETDKLITYWEYITVKISPSKTNPDRFSLTVLGCTDNERNIFIKCFSEMFVFDDNSRYILKFQYKNNTRYLPVPEIIGLKQEYVKRFVRSIKEILSKDLVSVNNMYAGTVFVVLFSLGVFLFWYLVWALWFLFFSFFIPIWLYNKLLQLQEPQKIDIIFAKSAKNRQEVLKAKYNTYLQADIKQSRIWI